MSAPAELVELSLTEASGLLTSRVVSAKDLTESALERIEKLQAPLNAFIWIDAEGARRKADEIDLARARNTELPVLAGIPMAHKDMFDLGGRLATCGSNIRADHAPRGMATAIARLEDQGSITLGGLNMAEFAQGPTGHNAHFGDCRNPWSLPYISGGSSSGSGAAVAARLVFASIGSDTGGSIRIPSSCCGVTGLKPTYGRVSRHGAMPLSFSMDCIGPLARTAADCALMMEAIAGPDAQDPTSAGTPVPAYSRNLTGDLSDCRIGVPSNWGTLDLDPEVEAAFAAALEVLVSRGATLSRIDIPVMPDISACSAVVSRVELGAVHADWMRRRPQDYAANVSGRMYPAYAIPGTYYVEALRRRGSILATFCQEVFGKVDLIAVPTIPKRIPTRAETDIESGAEGVLERFLSPSANTRLLSYLGLPAISVPMSFDSRGLPMGLQIAARPFGEGRLLRAGEAYQRDTAWHNASPLPKLEEGIR
ncbi:amidase [Corticibacterium sp. UT-5YL-CI-8]|nr:amidase [Tianweitania sp. UT-5YL-CI-8]